MLTKNSHLLLQVCIASMVESNDLKVKCIDEIMDYVLDWRNLEERNVMLCTLIETLQKPKFSLIELAKCLKIDKSMNEELLMIKGFNIDSFKQEFLD